MGDGLTIDNEPRFYRFTGSQWRVQPRDSIMHATGPIRTVEFDTGATNTFNNIQPTFRRFENMVVNSISFHDSTFESYTEIEYIGDNGARMSVKVASLEPVDNNAMHTIQLLRGDKIQIDDKEYMLLEPVRVTWDRQGL